MRYLRPLHLKKSYYDKIEATINRLFYEMCFEPIVAAFAKNSAGTGILRNAIDPIGTALRKGKIFYIDGKFTGEFDARLSKEFQRLGATFNKATKSWSFKVLPPSLQIAVADAELRMEKIRETILRNLADVNINQDTMRSRIIQEYQRTVKQINDDFLKTVKGVSIPPELTKNMQHNIAKAWGQNLELYIKKWTAENILKLREEVATNTYHGRRAEGLVKNIQADYGISKRKAKFLARQETSLLMSKMREERYKDAGITMYKWSGAMDQRERHDHKLLEGNVYSWDNPPIVDRATGRRAHPGEDYNCRCVAIPIVN